VDEHESSSSSCFKTILFSQQARDYAAAKVSFDSLQIQMNIYPNPSAITPQETFLALISKRLAKNPLFEVTSLHGPTGLL
jgi:hypothetical protein